MLYLYHVNNQQYYEITDQLTIGRTSGDIICPEDGRMSGKHAQVSVETLAGETSIYIQDLGSKNFTIVNRAEIRPKKIVKIKLFNFLEVGDQQFIVTDNKETKLIDLNEMISKYVNRSITKIDLEIILPGRVDAPAEVSAFELMQQKEAKILQLQKEMLTLEKSAKNDILKLDEAREKVIINAKAKKAEISKTIEELQLVVDKSKEEMLKVKAEIELKKKKIINLKDLPSDSTEELPE